MGLHRARERCAEGVALGAVCACESRSETRGRDGCACGGMVRLRFSRSARWSAMPGQCGCFGARGALRAGGVGVCPELPRVCTQKPTFAYKSLHEWGGGAVGAAFGADNGRRSAGTLHRRRGERRQGPGMAGLILPRRRGARFDETCRSLMRNDRPARILAFLIIGAAPAALSRRTGPSPESCRRARGWWREGPPGRRSAPRCGGCI